MVEKTWDQLEKYQPTVLKMLAKSIQKQRVAHAYLFEGNRGTGKKDVSLLFAKSLFCTERNQYKPCEICINCKRISSGNHPDLHVIEPDGLSIKKGQIQALQMEFSKTGVESNKKIYIINHADKMTPNAANSLLKFLEEPSSQTVAILITENIHRMLNTILSRCQILSFKPLVPAVIIDYLENNGVSKEKAPLIAQITNNLEEAYELSHDEWFAQARKIVIKLYETLNHNHAQALFFIQDKWLPHFSDKEKLDIGLQILLYIYRDLIYIQIGEEQHAVLKDEINQLKQYALQTSRNRVTEQMSIILDIKGRLNTNMNPHLLMEQLVLKLQEGY